jgi:predicted PurR-regulated permease PerM
MTASSHHETGDRSGRVIRMVLVVGIFALALAVFSPFVSPLLWSAVLCYALYPFTEGWFGPQAAGVR